ncbi:hypothetical protein ElyMa_007051500 [Elysia marginata]|uniref:Uncharacterized protein n=1 Tax=Elysia marginata TaxID=1093978 RepID=A0AAV4JWA6_9GAST|nr:hypothetical protein ElyMa_007051500 [Elysia marginata]
MSLFLRENKPVSKREPSHENNSVPLTSTTAEITLQAETEVLTEPTPNSSEKTRLSVDEDRDDLNAESAEREDLLGKQDVAAVRKDLTTEITLKSALIIRRYRTCYPELLEITGVQTPAFKPAMPVDGVKETISKLEDGRPKCGGESLSDDDEFA